MTFDGFPVGVRQWFQGLEADNSKAYFSAHREFYEESIREQMELLLAQLSQTFGGQVKMFRQNHTMARDQLEHFREAVVDDPHGAELARRVAAARAAGLELWGQSLATAPRGYPRDHPRIELLRRRSLTLGATLGFGRGISAPDGVQFVSQTWKTSAPVTDWLDQHVGASTLPIDRGRWRRASAG